MIKNIWLVISAIATIGGLLAFKVLESRVTITPSFVLDPKNPFATPFIIKNEGSFVIYDISAKTFVTATTSNTVFNNSDFKNNINNSQKLNFGKETSISINMETFVSGISLTYKPGASITINLKYASNAILNMLHIYHQENYGFVMMQSTSGESVWYPLNK